MNRERGGARTVSTRRHRDSLQPLGNLELPRSRLPRWLVETHLTLAMTLAPQRLRELSVCLLAVVLPAAGAAILVVEDRDA